MSEPTSATPAGSSRRLLPLVLALAIVAVIAVAAVAFSLLRPADPGSPEYSLSEMARAARSRDWPGVKRYLDVESVASSYIGAVISNAFGTLSGDATGTGSAGGMMSRDSAASQPLTGEGMAAKAVANFKVSLQRAVEKATDARVEGLSGFLFAEKPKDVAYVGKDVAVVTVEVAVSGGGTQDVKLRMERSGDHWRATTFENMSDLLSIAF